MPKALRQKLARHFSKGGRRHGHESYSQIGSFRRPDIPISVHGHGSALALIAGAIVE